MPRSSLLVVTALLAALSAVPPLTINMYLSSLPSMVADLDTTVAMVQLTISTFFVAFAVSQLAYGPLSDRYGRRPLLVGSLAIYMTGSVACALAPNVEMLIVARLVQAVGACGAPVLARAVVVDLYGRERAASVLAYMGAVMGIAPAIGPFIGGVIESYYGWRAIFWLLSLLAIVLFASTWILLSESNARLDRFALQPKRMLRNYGNLLTSRIFLGYTLTLSCAFAGVFSYMSSSPYIFIDLIGLSPETFGALFLLTAGAWMISSIVTGRITPRVGLDRMLTIGVLLIVAAGSVLAGLVFAGHLTVAPILLPMVVYAYAMGIVIHNTMAGAVTPFRHMAGSASALLGFLQMGAAASTTFAMGYFYDDTAVPMAIGVGLFSLLCAAAFFLLIRPRHAGP